MATSVICLETRRKGRNWMETEGQKRSTGKGQMLGFLAVEEDGEGQRGDRKIRG